MTMRHLDGMQKLTRTAFIATIALGIITATVWGIRLFAMSRNQTVTQSTNPANYPIGGFPMTGNLAPDFKLTDQFGHSVTLSSLRGHEVVLAFIDSRCKTLCPLTANIMYDAKVRLGAEASSQVALVAVNANPTATSVAAVQVWSIAHGLLHQWLFLNRPVRALLYLGHPPRLLHQLFPEPPSPGRHDLPLRSWDRDNHPADRDGCIGDPATLDGTAHGHLRHRRLAHARARGLYPVWWADPPADPRPTCGWHPDVCRHFWEGGFTIHLHHPRFSGSLCGICSVGREGEVSIRPALVVIVPIAGISC